MDTFFADKRRWSSADVAQMLVSHNALKNLTQEDAAALVKHMKPKRVSPGTVLLREGDANSEFLMFILQGEAVVDSSMPGQDGTAPRLLGQGDLVSEPGMPDHRSRLPTVTAASEMALAVLDEDSFANIVRDKPALACGFMGIMLQSLGNRLRESNARVRMLTSVNNSLHTELTALRGTGLGLPAVMSARPPLDAEPVAPANDKRAPHFSSTYPLNG